MSYKAENVYSTNSSAAQISRQGLLDWVNGKLGTHFTKVEELCSGAAYCQLMDILFTGCLPMKKVRFQTKLEHEYLHNFKLLQMAFERCNVQKHIPMEKLVLGRFQENFEFGQWFKKFYTMNSAQENVEYNPLERRFNQEIMTGEMIVIGAGSSPRKNLAKISPTQKDGNAASKLKNIEPSMANANALGVESRAEGLAPCGNNDPRLVLSEQEMLKFVEGIHGPETEMKMKMLEEKELAQTIVDLTSERDVYCKRLEEVEQFINQKVTEAMLMEQDIVTNKMGPLKSFASEILKIIHRPNDDLDTVVLSETDDKVKNLEESLMNPMSDGSNLIAIVDKTDDVDADSLASGAIDQLVHNESLENDEEIGEQSQLETSSRLASAPDGKSED